jgi:hypothetical protein
VRIKLRPAGPVVSRLRRIVRTRALGITYLAVGLVVAAAGSAMLFSAHASESDILVNVGSNLVDAVVFFAVITPIVAVISDNSAKWNRRLNLDEIADDIRKSRKRVDIVETWTPLFDERRRERSHNAIRAALQNGTRFRVVILDPSCQAARDRDVALNLNPPVLQRIRDNVDQFAQVLAANPEYRHQIEVKVAGTAPLRQMYRVDDDITYAYFPANKAANESPQNKTVVSDNAGDLVMLWFLQAWSDTALVDLDAFIAARIVLPDSAEESMCGYVQTDGSLWINVTPTQRAEEFDAWRRDGREVRVTIGEDGDTALPLTDDEPGDDITTLYREKYGTASDLRLVAIRLPVQRPGD